MITGKTSTGFKYSFDERILNDWRFIDAIAQVQSKNDNEKLIGATTMVKLLLGSDGVDKLKEFIAKNNDGFVPVDKLMAEITSIISSNKETKN